jgi:hypothetical protein
MLRNVNVEVEAVELDIVRSVESLLGENPSVEACWPKISHIN